MANQKTSDYLIKVGQEGFAMIDAYYGGNRRPSQSSKKDVKGLAEQPENEQEVSLQHPLKKPRIKRYRMIRFLYIARGGRARGEFSQDFREKIEVKQARIFLNLLVHSETSKIGFRVIEEDMANQKTSDYLIKVGQEGFAMIDAYYGGKRRPFSNQGVLMDNITVAKKYGEKTSLNGRPMAPPPSSNRGSSSRN
ncbi:hypothetical protein NE237_007165 [Protea cynaroides]|uniref:Uncharacterized protein n=1 Tax=Protea cynaroides TaxID=273540 RepID=A0A9Q0KNY0_9MAGN|nr:hypothetical protein NE237_007165 [Protea cynaroides]